MASVVKLKDELKDLKSVHIDVSPKPSTSSNVPPAVNPNGFSLADGKTETTGNLDESIASTEELIEDVSGDSSPPYQLNCRGILRAAAVTFSTSSILIFINQTSYSSVNPCSSSMI